MAEDITVPIVADSISQTQYIEVISVAEKITRAVHRDTRSATNMLQDLAFRSETIGITIPKDAAPVFIPTPIPGRAQSVGDNAYNIVESENFESGPGGWNGGKVSGSKLIVDSKVQQIFDHLTPGAKYRLSIITSDKIRVEIDYADGSSYHTSYNAPIVGAITKSAILAITIVGKATIEHITLEQEDGYETNGTLSDLKCDIELFSPLSGEVTIYNAVATVYYSDDSTPDHLSGSINRKTLRVVENATINVADINGLSVANEGKISITFMNPKPLPIQRVEIFFLIGSTCPDGITVLKLLAIDDGQVEHEFTMPVGTGEFLSGTASARWEKFQFSMDNAEGSGLIQRSSAASPITGKAKAVKLSISKSQLPTFGLDDVPSNGPHYYKMSTEVESAQVQAVEPCCTIGALRSSANVATNLDIRRELVSPSYYNNAGLDIDLTVRQAAIIFGIDLSTHTPYYRDFNTNIFTDARLTDILTSGTSLVFISSDLNQTTGKARISRYLQNNPEILPARMVW